MNSDILGTVRSMGLTALYHVALEACDDAENFIIELGATDLPCLCIFEKGRLQYLACGSTLAPVTVKMGYQNSLVSELRHPLLGKGAMPVRLFISGDRSSVGKSTFCLFLLATLLNIGYKASELAYIKPVTQCEAEQPVVRFCDSVGISCEGIGPVVFYKGFTRAFLEGATASSADMLGSVVNAVSAIQMGKRIVIIDGVGYPAVGSICGVSNADVARALSAPVLLVGKSGVGDAVDSFNLNARFFENAGVRVLGGVFNKIALEGFYNLEACRSSVSSYFSQYRRECAVYGFIPMMNHLVSPGGDGQISPDGEALSLFEEHVDVKQLLVDAYMHEIDRDRKILAEVPLRVRYGDQPKSPPARTTSNAPPTPMVTYSTDSNDISGNKRKTPPTDSTFPQMKLQPSDRVVKKTRAEIEALATRQGAAGG